MFYHQRRATSNQRMQLPGSLLEKPNEYLHQTPMEKIDFSRTSSGPLSTPASSSTPAIRVSDTSNTNVQNMVTMMNMMQQNPQLQTQETMLTFMNMMQQQMSTSTGGEDGSWSKGQGKGKNRGKGGKKGGKSKGKGKGKWQ